MTTNHICSTRLSNQNVTFQERSRCICCGSSKLNPIWQGKFRDEPTRSYIQRCHYSEDIIALLGEETFSLVSCQTCGTTFHQRILTSEWLQLLYSRWIDDTQIKHMEAEYQQAGKRDIFLEGWRQPSKHLLRLQKLLKKNTNEPPKILDYGCGDGYFLSLAKLFGFEAYGIDFSTVRNERARNTGVPIFESLEVLESKRIGKLDAVTLFQVLEHLEEPITVLKRIRNLMKDGGILIVEVPNCRGIKQPQNFLEFTSVHPLEHINAFTPITLKRMCQQAGFATIKSIPAHITTDLLEILRTEMSRWIQLERTNKYFQLQKQV